MHADDPQGAGLSEEAPFRAPPGAFTVRPPRTSWAATTLVALNLAVFAAMALANVSYVGFAGRDWWVGPFHVDWEGLTRSMTDPGLGEVLGFGANHGPFVARGEWWRLVSSAFVHIGAIHLVLNMFALGSLRIVESFYGNGGFVLLYLASAVGGSIASVLWTPGGVSAGASGAVFGIAGAFAAFFLAHKRSMPAGLFQRVMRNLVFLLGVNVLFGFLMSGIDNAAHLGGLASGFIAGRLLDRDLDLEPRLDRRRLLRISALFAAFGVLALAIPWRARGADRLRIQLVEDDALHAAQTGNLDQLAEISARGLAEDPENKLLLELHAQAVLARGDERAALRDFDVLLAVDPDNASARHTRTYLFWALDQPDKAIADATELLRRHPEVRQARQMRGELHYALAQWREAAEDFGVLARGDGPNAAEGQVFLWLARQRLGEREAAAAELARYVEEPHFSDTVELDVAVAALYAGALDEVSLLGTFDRAKTAVADRTRLFFFAGSRRLVRGDEAGARALFEQARDRGTRDESTWRLAVAELARLRAR